MKKLMMFFILMLMSFVYGSDFKLIYPPAPEKSKEAMNFIAWQLTSGAVNATKDVRFKWIVPLKENVLRELGDYCDMAAAKATKQRMRLWFITAAALCDACIANDKSAIKKAAIDLCSIEKDIKDFDEINQLKE